MINPEDVMLSPASNPGSDPQLPTTADPPPPPAGVLRAIAHWLLTIFEIPFRLIFGRDVFISYSHSNATYAENLVVGVQKEYKAQHGGNLSFYLDRWASTSSTSLPLSLRLQLRWSGMLVVLCTAEAIGSKFVKEEVARFTRLRRKVLVVDVGESLASVRDEDPWKAARSTGPESESRKEFDKGAPSPRVVNRVLKMADFTTQDRRLRRAVWTTVTVIALGSAYAYAIVSSAQAQAASARAEAQGLRTLADDAERRRTEADSAMRLAQDSAQIARGQRDTALTDKRNAQLAAQSARRARDVALADRDRAMVERDQAAAEAREQTRIAREQTRIAAEQAALAARAEQRRRVAIRGVHAASATRISESLGDLGLLQPAVRAALHSYMEWNPDTSAVPESGTVPDRFRVALTDAALSMRRNGSRVGVGAFPRVKDVDVSSGGDLMVTVGYRSPEQERAFRPVATLWDVRSRRWFWEDSAATSRTTAAAISPDGKTLAIGSANGELRFFGIDGPSVVPSSFMRFPRTVATVRFTENGKQVVVWADTNAWNGGNLFLADPATGTVRPLPLPADQSRLYFGNADAFADVQQVPPVIGVLDRRGRLVTVDTRTGAVAELDLANKRLRRRIGGALQPRHSVLAPDGRWLAAIQSRDEERLPRPVLIDLECVAGRKGRCEPVHELPRIHPQDEPVLAFDPTGTRLFVSEKERVLQVYEVTRAADSNTPPHAFTFPAAFRIMGFTDGGTRVVAMVDNTRDATPGELQVYDPTARRVTAEYSLGDQQAYWRHLNLRQALGGVFQVGLVGSALHIWDNSPIAGSELRYDPASIGIDLGRATDATIAPDGKLAASAHPAGYVAVWRLADRALVGVIRGLRGDGVLTEWAGTPERPTLYAASRAGQVVRWTPGGAPGGTLDGLAVPAAVAEVTGLQVSRDGRTVAVHGAGGPVAVWTGERWMEVEETRRPLALSGDGRRLAVGRADGGVDVVGLYTGQHTALPPPELSLCAPVRVRFALDDSRVVAEGCPGVSVWDSPGGALPAADAATPAAELWAQHFDGGINVVDVRSGAIISRVAGRSELEGVDTRFGGPPTAFAFAPSADLAAAAHNDTIQVWRLSSREAVSYVPRSHESSRVEFLPGGDALLVVMPGGTPAIVPLDLRAQLRSLCPLLLAGSDFGDASSSGAYALCWSTFRQMTEQGPVGSTGVWVREAASR
jgi:WD40 repeat protein